MDKIINSSPYIFSVSELTQGIKDILESKFPFVWVKGQISNYTVASSGHIYFTLKDEGACLDIVWFKGNQLGFSKLKTLLKDGQEVLCAGKLNVYPPRGRYQLIIEFVQEVGTGTLFLAFEKLKEKLAQEGLFSPDTKKEIPFNPTVVGVITAPNSAALQDFLTISSQYGLEKRFILYPTSVQGEESISQIVKAIEIANIHAKAEVLVLIRGGGSLEDLWSFNTEEVARAIFSSKIPIITGIGHEIDTTIADLVADKRASTPSHVPQLLWMKKQELFFKVQQLEENLWQAIDGFLYKKEHNLSNKIREFSFLNPFKKIESLEDKFNSFQLILENKFNLFLTRKIKDFSALEQKIVSFFSPEYFKLYFQKIRGLEENLIQNCLQLLTKKENQLKLLNNQISNLDPFLPLNRGYSLVKIKSSGEIVKSIRQLKTGEKVEIRVKDGSKEAKIC